jgi:hypothetical protein
VAVRMRVHLVNPSDVSFGIGVVTPRWLYVIAAATPASYGDPIITDETLERFDADRLRPGDVMVSACIQPMRSAGSSSGAWHGSEGPGSSSAEFMHRCGR